MICVGGIWILLGNRELSLSKTSSHILSNNIHVSFSFVKVH